MNLFVFVQRAGVERICLRPLCGPEGEKITYGDKTGTKSDETRFRGNQESFLRRRSGQRPAQRSPAWDRPPADAERLPQLLSMRVVLRRRRTATRPSPPDSRLRGNSTCPDSFKLYVGASLLKSNRKGY